MSTNPRPEKIRTRVYCRSQLTGPHYIRPTVDLRIAANAADCICALRC